MSRYKPDDDRDNAGAATEIIPSPDGRGKCGNIPPDDGTPPRLQVQFIERTAIVRFVDSEILFEEAGVRAISQQLHHLLEEGHTRLLLNLEGIRYMSAGMLATLVGLQQRVERAQGRLGLFGLDPVLRDMVRICRLERVFEIFADEREALSGGWAGDDRPRLERSRPIDPRVKIAPKCTAVGFRTDGAETPYGAPPCHPGNHRTPA